MLISSLFCSRSTRAIIRLESYPWRVQYSHDGLAFGTATNVLTCMHIYSRPRLCLKKKKRVGWSELATGRDSIQRWNRNKELGRPGLVECKASSTSLRPFVRYVWGLFAYEAMCLSATEPGQAVQERKVAPAAWIEQIATAISGKIAASRFKGYFLKTYPHF